MKNTLKNICLAVAAGLGVSLTSCSDFMDLSPRDQYDQGAVFSDPGLVETVVNDIYGYVPHFSDECNLSGATDDAYFTHDYGMKAMSEATTSGSYLGWYDNGVNPFNWSNTYRGIYRANLVINNIDNVPAAAGYDLTRMKGEAYFLRGYLYHELLRGYGGVPIVLKDYDLTSAQEAAQKGFTRANVSEVLNQIISDLDEAEKYLPDVQTGSNTGRATKWAAEALKARILLHVASPLYADRAINTLACNQYNGDRNALYQQAVAAAKKVIDSGHFSLVQCTADTPEATGENWHQIFLYDNPEQIFYKEFINKVGGNMYNRNRIGVVHGPNGYHAWGGTTPTHDLANSFEMNDGSLYKNLQKIGDKVDSNPYVGREPRFYGTIGYDGAVWGRQRPADVQGLDPTPLGQLQMGYYEVPGGSNCSVVFNDGTSSPIVKYAYTGIYGCDTRKSSIEDWNGSFTGYLEKKLIDTTIAASEETFQPGQLPYIRLAEMYFIVAEADIELGNLTEAAEYLDAIRSRIGLPATAETLALRGKSMNQDDMREFLRLERRSEFAYEEFRFFDITRWMIGDITGNKKLAGIYVQATPKPGKSPSLPYIHSDEDYNYNYQVIDLSYRENRAWDNKRYFAPIDRDEVNRLGIEQNPGNE